MAFAATMEVRTAPIHFAHTSKQPQCETHQFWQTPEGYYELFYDDVPFFRSQGIFGRRENIRLPVSVPNPTPAPTSSSTLRPTLRPTSNPTPMPSTSSNDSISCGSNQISFDFSLNTDDYAEETSWDLTNDSTGLEVIVGTNLGDDASYRIQECLPQDCYTLALRDSFGDGLISGGTNPGFRLVVDGQLIAEASGEDFGFQVLMEFGSCDEDSSGPVPVPTPAPTDAPPTRPCNFFASLFGLC